jgi:hypothetical protein
VTACSSETSADFQWTEQHYRMVIDVLSMVISQKKELVDILAVGSLSSC